MATGHDEWLVLAHDARSDSRSQAVAFKPNWFYNGGADLAGGSFDPPPTAGRARRIRFVGDATNQMRLRAAPSAARS